MKGITRRTGEEILDFLERQRLAPTPGNYALGYHVVVGGTIVARAVAAIVEGGVRITQAEVDEIMGSTGDEARSADERGREAAERDALRHQMIRFADAASDHSAATTRFGRDLALDAERLGDDGGILANLVADMIRRTEQAERELARSADETNRLRLDLESARSDALQDALTGLPNRRALDAHLAGLAAGGATYAVVMVDVDRFKRINDAYGHAVGDRVLKGVAETLRGSCADEAFVARAGGEEFCIVVETGDPERAARLADDGRVALGERRFRVRDTDQPIGRVSYSAGVAMGSGDPASLLARADELLYRAKEEGRDRVLGA